MHFTVAGCVPGLSRAEVRGRLGEPLGDVWLEDRPPGVPPVPLERAPVWRFPAVAVVFRDDRAIEVWGNQLQADGREILAGQTWGQVFDSLGLRRESVWWFGSRCLTGGGDGLTLYPSGEFRVRLRTVHPIHSLTRRSAWLRERVAGAARPSPGTRVDLVTRSQQPPDWATDLAQWIRLPQDKFGLRWTPLGLQHALRECLEHERSYTGTTRSRSLLGAGVGTIARRRAELHATVTGSGCHLAEEEPDSECWPILQRLSLVGDLSPDLTWAERLPPHRVEIDGEQAHEIDVDSFRRARELLPLVTQDRLPSDALRLAARIARLVDSGRGVTYLGTGEDLGYHAHLLTTNLGDEWDKPGHLYFQDGSSPEYDLFDEGEGQFTALATRSRNPLPMQPMPIFQRIHRERTRMRALGVQADDLSGLTAESEIQLMRRVEQFPHLNWDEPHHVATFLGALTRESERWEPSTPAGRALALALAIVLENGLAYLRIQ